MSVLFLPPSAGAASVPDASETVSGKIRIATSAEATAGTNDLTAMTPAKTKSVVDAAVVGGVTYQGTFDASAPADLSNATKGDLYIISVAGTYQGQTWAVGDHLLINADMGGTLDPAKIDKVDNTDSVTSVAGRTGAVTLSTADISGLATVASTGAYSDLTGAPTLATVATTGAYSDLSGTPTLGTAAAEDVGTAAGNVVQLNGSAQLPAVDGSLLTGITASVAALDDVGDVNITSVQDYAVLKYDSGTSEWIDAPQINYVYTSTTQSLDLKPGVNRVTMAGASSITLTLGIPTLVASQGAVFSVLSTGSATNTLTIGSTSWNFDQHQGGVFVATGLNTAYMVSTIDYNQLENLPTLGTAAALDVGTSASNVVQLDGSARLPAVDGSQLTNLPTGGFTYQEQSTNAFNVSVTDSTNNIVMCSILGTNTTVLPASSGVADGSVVTVRAATATTLSISGGENIRNLGGSLVASVSIEGGQNMSFVRASTSSFGTYWNQLTVEENTLNSLSDVNTSGAVATNVLKYDGTDWVDGAVAYSEVTGTPTLATVATTGAYSDLTGTPTLATVATTGAYSDLTGTPTLGTAAAEDVGTLAGNVVQLDGTAKLPAVDGSQLTNLPSGVTTLGALTDVDVTGAVNTNVLKYNSTSGDWEDGAVAYSEVTGTPTLATVATTGAYSDLTGTPTLATVATTGAYSDLTGTPTLATVATTGAYSDLSGTPTNVSTFTNDAGYLTAITGESVGDLSDVTLTTPSAGQGLIYNGTLSVFENATITATVSALNDIGDVSAASPNNGDVIAYNSTSGDWEATAQSGGGGSAPSVTVSSPSADQTLTSPSGIEEVYIYTPSANINVNLVAAATCGSGFKYQIKNRSTNTLTIDPNGAETIDGSATFVIASQEASVTLITDGSNWFII
jgi:hypothetical protein